MTTYNVHIYREMRLVFGDIEADSPEAAASIARGKPTDDADSIDDCDGETIAALVDMVGDEDYSQSVTVDFEQERLRKAAPALLTACRMVVDRWERGDLAEAARACSSAIAEAEAAGIAPNQVDREHRAAAKLLAALEYALEFLEANDDGEHDVTSRITVSRDAIAGAKAAGMTPTPADPANKPYSVLLLYPDDVNDGGSETYYAWVEAPDSIVAVAEAQRQALATNEWTDRDPADFAPLLVTQGHHYGQPMSHD